MSAIILPRAIYSLFTGVTSKVAIVPLSFSPAIDSDATLTLPVTRNTISINGMNIVSIIFTTSSSVAMSGFSTPAFIA